MSRRTLAVFFCLAGVTTIIAQQKPDFSGEWKLNRQASTLSPLVAPAAQRSHRSCFLRYSDDTVARRKGTIRVAYDAGMVNLIDLGMNMQMTTDAARFTHNQNSNVLSLEANLFTLVGGALKAKGHEVRSVTGGAVGGYQGILFTRDPRMPEPIFDQRAATDDLPVNGVYRAGSDHRKDGQAVGW